MQTKHKTDMYTKHTKPDMLTNTKTQLCRQNIQHRHIDKTQTTLTCRQNTKQTCTQNTQKQIC